MPANDALKSLGAAIRHRREELSLSQEELAEKAGLHRNYVGGVERGERNVAFLNLVKLARALDLSLAALIEEVESSMDERHR